MISDPTAWIDAHVERTGPLEVILSREWSTVARVPTSAGDVWLKEVPPSLGFEPALTAALAGRHPEHLPEVLAADERRLLTRDAGRRLRNVHDAEEAAPTWDELLPLLAELQLELATEADCALQLGTPDARPEALERILDDVGGGGRRKDLVRRAVDGLGAHLPTTVVHTEAHDGNLFLLDGRVRVLDWAEAVVSHPFVGMVLPLRFAVERTGAAGGRLRDAYLEPFTAYAPEGELRESFAHGYLLGTLVRAFTWHALADSGDAVAAWLEIFDGVAAGTITLGEA